MGAGAPQQPVQDLRIILGRQVYIYIRGRAHTYHQSLQTMCGLQVPMGSMGDALYDRSSDRQIQLGTYLRQASADVLIITIRVRGSSYSPGEPGRCLQCLIYLIIIGLLIKRMWVWAAAAYMQLLQPRLLGGRRA